MFSVRLSSYPKLQDKMQNKVYPSYPPGAVPEEPAPAYSAPPPAAYGHASTHMTSHMSSAHAVTTQPNVVVVNQPVAAGPPRPSDYMILSCVTFWCCNCLFGGIAIIFSFMSSSAADGGDMEKARTYGRIAMVLNIVGTVITVLLVIIVPVVVLVAAASSSSSSGCVYDKCDGECCRASETCCTSIYTNNDYCC